MKFQLCVFTCLISIIQSSTSYGQEIEIIEVSAQKRSQDIRDVTSSISVLDGIEVSSQHLKDTTALSAMAPNFKISQNAAEGTPPAINIRGVGSIDYNTSTQSPVGVYLDGSAGASANAQLVNLFDIKSVQILRGPQGTLFGRNTTGGAVLIESNDALFENSGYVNFAYGQRQHTALEGAINRQISSNVAARLAINHQDYQYSTQNLFPNTPQAKMKQSHARLSFYGQWEKLTLNTKVNLGKW